MTLEQWKLVRALGGSDELFRLRSHSPYQTVNLAHADPGQLQAMRASLYDWFFPYRAYLVLARWP